MKKITNLLNKTLPVSLKTGCFFVIMLMSIYFLMPAGMCSAQSDSSKAGREDALNSLKNEVLSYFEPITGKIVSVAAAPDSSLKIESEMPGSIKKGMRFRAFQEGVSFIHPVTKEPLGRMEMPIGEIEITRTSPELEGIIIKGNPEDFLNAKIKIPATKIRILFYQGNVNWFLGDAYYNMLRESGRFELSDTGIETNEIDKIVADAVSRNTDAVLVLKSEDSADHVNLTQKLYWTSDSKIFSDKSAAVDAAFVKDLRARSGIFSSMEGEILLSYQLPFGSQRLATGDLDGNGDAEIILTASNSIRVYRSGVDLNPLWEFRIPNSGDILWLDTGDFNKNKKDEMLITAMHNGNVVSYIYELQDSGFVQLYRAEDAFLRLVEGRVISQGYNKLYGYDGSIFVINHFEGGYKKGDAIKLPDGLNIYDFVFVYAPDGRQGILAWDDRGHLNLYDEKGIRIWISKETFGGFTTTFKKESLSGMIDKGFWSVKDKLIQRGSEIILPIRTPLVAQATGLGYKKSELKTFWWNGVALEERKLLENINGEILDYAISGDKMMVLSKPLFGIRFENILKGKNPIGTMLYIYSLKEI